MNNNTQIPTLYIEHLAKQLPSNIQINDVIAACKKPLRISGRVNTLKISVNDCIELWQSLGWSAEPIPWCSEGFWLEPIDANQYVALGNSFAHTQGVFYLQEASSMLPAMAFTQANDTQQFLILDMAAAPGSKTTQLACLFPDSHIVANELSASRLKSLHHNLLRCGIANQTLTNFDAKVFGEYQQETFDRVLLDAPCSGEGTVRRDPDALKTWTHALSDELATLQLSLMTSAFHALKVGGELVYSTCTLSKEENQHVLSAFLAMFGNHVHIEPLNSLFPAADISATKEGYLHVFPNMYDTGGFFVAKLIKKSSAPLPTAKKAKTRKAVFTPLSNKAIDALSAYLQHQFGFNNSTLHSDLYERDKEIWWLPDIGQNVAQHMHISRSGIKIAETFKNGFRLHHECVNCFAEQFQNGCISITKQEAVQYLKGQDIHIAQEERLTSLPTSGDIVVFYQGFPLGCAKRIKQRLKNALPRDKVRDKAYQ